MNLIDRAYFAGAVTAAGSWALENGQPTLAALVMAAGWLLYWRTHSTYNQRTPKEER